MDNINSFKDQIQDSINTKQKLLPLTSEIERIAKEVVACLNNGNKVLIAGNGGSAGDAQHMAGELVGRFKTERRGLPCIALTTDTSVITAWVNDYDFNSLFARQIEALGKEGDVFIGLSTSGNSENIIKAIEKARQMGVKSILLLGKDGGKMKNSGDLRIIVPSNDTPRVQESHILIIHMICDYVDKNIK